MTQMEAISRDLCGGYEGNPRWTTIRIPHLS